MDILVCLFIFCRLLYFVLCTFDIKGHLEPLGSHSSPTPGGVKIVESFPPSKDFYYDYVDKEQPFLVKNILHQIDFPAFRLWDDPYLKSKYGQEVVDVELEKKEDRINGELKPMTLSDFLDVYNKSKVYLVQDAPDAMRKDIALPVSLHCGGFRENFKTAFLWLSSGGTKSVLHADDMDNINCLLDGEKTLIIIDRKYQPLVEANGFRQVGAFSTVDVESVDFVKFPQLQHVPWYNVTLNKGDCLYIPYRWYHQVTSKEGRNFAVNLWFYRPWWFNETDCRRAVSLQTKVFLDSIKPASDLLSKKAFLLENLPRPKSTYSLKTFIESTYEGFFSEHGEGYTRKVFYFLDKNNDNMLTWEELYGFDMDEAVKLFPKIFTVEENEEEGAHADGNEQEFSQTDQNHSEL